MKSKPSISSSSSAERIAEIRTQIDDIDERLHRALLERMDYTGKLAELKKPDSVGGSAYRPGREAQLLARRAAAHLDEMRGKMHGEMSLATLVQIWREIISASLRLQRTPEERTLPVILAASEQARAEALASARGWAGAAARVEMALDLRDFFARMDEHQVMIGLMDIAMPGAWWRLMNGAAHKTHIVARWPFIASDATRPLYVLANMMPEASGNDLSLYVQDDKIVEIEGFVLPDDGDDPDRRFLGCHARALDE